MAIRGFPSGVLRRAHQSYKCDECGHPIPEGSDYRYIASTRNALPYVRRYHYGCDPLSTRQSACLLCVPNPANLLKGG